MTLGFLDAADKSVEQPAKKRKKSHGTSEEVSRGHDRIPVTGQELESKLRLQQSCVEMLAQLLQVDPHNPANFESHSVASFVQDATYLKV